MCGRILTAPWLWFKTEWHSVATVATLQAAISS